MKTVKDIGIDRPIAIFGSGMSILKMANDDIRAIKQKCFTIFMNYAMCHFGSEEMDMLVWHDWNVSHWLMDGNLKPEIKLWASEAAFPFGLPTILREKVDCWIESSTGNFTLTNVLHDLRRYYPDRYILLFGVDFKVESGLYYKAGSRVNFKVIKPGTDLEAEPRVNLKVEPGENTKWYDVFIDTDKKRRIDKNSHDRCFAAQRRELVRVDTGSKILNCNPESALEVFPKVDWKEVLGL